MNKNSLLIGITGGTGAGKTRLVSHLSDRLSRENLTVVNQDNYYKPLHTQPIDPNGIENFDTLQSIDPIQMEQDLKILLSGKSFRQQVYNFNKPIEDREWIEVQPAPVIVVEGLFALSFPEIFNLTEISIFVDTAEERMLSRRIARDWDERGYDAEDVTYRFYNHFLPAYKQHVLPIRDKATFVIDNNGSFEKAVLDLEDRITGKIDFLK